MSRDPVELDPLRVAHYRRRAVQRPSCLLISAACVLALAGVPTSQASAQDDQYTWGGSADGSAAAAGPSDDDPLRFMGYLGGGIGFRLVRNRDPIFGQDFITPGYLDIGGAVYFPGRELRFGAGLALSTNISQDPGTNDAANEPLEQWTLTPSFQLLLPLHYYIDGIDEDMLQVQFRVGVPVVLAAPGLGYSTTQVTFGGELAGSLHYKFLAGLGIYLEAQLTVVGGSSTPLDDAPTIHPLISIDAGFLIDYELLP